jgi:hypothetical protein
MQWNHLILPLVGLMTAESATAARAAERLNSSMKPVPLMQAIPLPKDEISFQRNGIELTRYYFGHDLNRPFLFPINGPSGRSLTRMGHPHDPETHSHHNSVWISHRDLDGLNFWEDRGKVRIVHKRIERLDDGPETASVTTLNAWTSDSGKVLLNEHRSIAVQNLTDGEWLLIIDLRFDTEKEPATFGKTPFGLIGVRMAKTIGVNDGGGTIRNSGGGVDEAGCFWKPARWVDYSGPMKTDAVEGISLMDHPGNSGHPSTYHVRNDGWMGIALTFASPRTIEPKAPLRLRYGLYIHAGLATPARLDEKWKLFSALPITRAERKD